MCKNLTQLTDYDSGQVQTQTGQMKKPVKNRFSPKKVNRDGSGQNETKTEERD